MTDKDLNHSVKILERWLDYQRYQERWPGISIGIVLKDKTIFKKGYGFANIEHKTKATDLTCYRIASISKIFTGIAIMQLIEQSKLNLSDKVVKYLPWFTSENEPKLKNISVKSLLNHTANITRDGTTLHWDNDKFPNVEELKREISKGITVILDNNKWKYSNFGYSILGSIIEKVSGMTYEEFIQKNIIKKIGLKYTSSVLTGTIRKYLATGYTKDLPGIKRTAFKDPETNAMAAAAGLSSNTQDMTKFMIANFGNNNSLLKKNTKQILRKLQWKDENSARNLVFAVWENDGHEILGHGGSFQGFSSRFGIDDENKVGVVIFINIINAPTKKILDNIFHTIYWTPKYTKQLNKLRQYPNNAKILEGRYIGRWGVTDVVALGNTLLAFNPAREKPLKYAQSLEYVGDDSFTIHSYDGYESIGQKLQFDIKNLRVV